MQDQDYPEYEDSYDGLPNIQKDRLILKEMINKEFNHFLEMFLSLEDPPCLDYTVEKDGVYLKITVETKI